MKIPAFKVEAEAMPRKATSRVARREHIDKATARRYKERPASEDFPFGIGAHGPVERCDRHLAAIQAENPAGAGFALQYLIVQHKIRAATTLVPYTEALKRLVKATAAMIEGLIFTIPQEQLETLILRTMEAGTILLIAMNAVPQRKG